MAFVSFGLGRWCIGPSPLPGKDTDMNPQEPVVPDPDAPESPLNPVADPPVTGDAGEYDV